jgi:hypothetical protein
MGSPLRTVRPKISVPDTVCNRDAADSEATARNLKGDDLNGKGVMGLGFAGWLELEI